MNGSMQSLEQTDRHNSELSRSLNSGATEDPGAMNAVLVSTHEVCLRINKNRRPTLFPDDHKTSKKSGHLT